MVCVFKGSNQAAVHPSAVAQTKTRMHLEQCCIPCKAANVNLLLAEPIDYWEHDVRLSCNCAVFKCCHTRNATKSFSNWTLINLRGNSWKWSSTWGPTNIYVYPAAGQLNGDHCEQQLMNAFNHNTYSIDQTIILTCAKKSWNLVLWISEHNEFKIIEYDHCDRRFVLVSGFLMYKTCPRLSGFTVVVPVALVFSHKPIMCSSLGTYSCVTIFTSFVFCGIKKQLMHGLSCRIVAQGSNKLCVCHDTYAVRK